jgi:hypothetical protein
MAKFRAGQGLQRNRREGATVTRSRRETLILTLPPDPGLARLGGVVALHFLRLNGAGAAAARRGARAVTRRCLALLKVAGRPAARGAGRGGRPVVLTLSSRAGELEVFGRPAADGSRSRLVRVLASAPLREGAGS